MRKVTIHRRSDTTGISLRCGDALLARLANLLGDERDGMTARAETTPAFADHRDRFRALAEAMRRGADGEADARRLRLEAEAAGIHVHHAVHDMRIDAAASISLVDGEVRFRPNDSFLMMRSGGLG